MGNNTSMFSSHGLYNKIQAELKTIADKFNFWTDQQLCNNLEVIYRDKLLKYNSSELLNVSTQLGIKYDVGSEINKQQICNNLINHYKKRIDLLIEISDGLTKCYNKTISAQKGPVCQKLDGYVEHFFKCNEYKGLWVSEEQYQTIINNIKATGRYDNWMEHIENLDSIWLKYLKQLAIIVSDIKKDIHTTMSEDSFNYLTLTTRDIIRNMDKTTDIFYLLVINFQEAK